MKIRTTYQGVTSTNQYVTIHFHLEVNGVSRAATVKVPLLMMGGDDWDQAMDRAARRMLIEAWSGEPIGEMLPPWQ